jgi:hypothetical protein
MLLPAFASAEVAGVTVTLESGEVVGQVRGLGTATLTARVTNETARTLEGIRLAAWYSPVDVFPDTSADWLIHEFVFDPPLGPGASTSLSFSDEGAAQYVLLQARAVKYRAALHYAGKIHDLRLPLLRRDGLASIAIRDLADVTGAKLTSSAGLVTLVVGGDQLQLRPGSKEASKNNAARLLLSPLFEDKGRTYITLQDAAALLGLELLDLGEELYELK